jgi:hypothetical protein
MNIKGNEICGAVKNESEKYVQYSKLITLFAFFFVVFQSFPSQLLPSISFAIPLPTG